MAALHCARHLLTAICLTASCHADITAGLRSWYPFEGNANDSSGSGNNGTIQGSPRFAAGQSGSGIRLTGPSDWVDIGPDTRLNTFTLAAWVRMDADANPPPSSDSRTSMDIFADGSSLQNFGIYVDRQFGGTQTQRFAGHAGSLYVYSTTQPQIGRLYHVAFSFDSAGIGKLYVDGVLESTASGGVIGTGATPDAKLGVRNNSAEYFKGLIDEARIYDRELSPAEIAQLSHPERVFADDFNRPDSAAVGNGWLDTTGNNGGNFGIVNGTLGVPNVPGGAGIYRPVPANQSIHIQCKLLDTTSSLRRGRYEHRVLLRNDGTRFKGYGLMLGRTDSALNNSMIHLISDEVILSSVKPSFEFPVPLYLDATYSPDGSVQGTVSGGGNLFAFSFPARNVPMGGGNFCFNCDFLGGGPGDTLQRLDDLAITYSVGEGVVEGTIGGATPGKTVRVIATASNATVTTSRTGDGFFQLSPLTVGQSYRLFAYEDSNDNGQQDFDEPVGEPATNPIPVNGLVQGVLITLQPSDADSDGLPDLWEQRYAISDPAVDADADGLSNLREFQFGSDPTKVDTDGDGVSDFEEWQSRGTSLTSSDTDSDGMTDGWEITNGLNPLLYDALDDRDLDGLTNREEFDRRTDGYMANAAFSFPNPPDGIPLSDYRRLKGEGWVRRVYDRNDRLIATERDSGVLQAYVYDGNSQKMRDLLASSLDADDDGLPDAWEFVHALAFGGAGAGTGGNGAAGDPDADGFTNAQEWKAGTDPMSSTSRPSFGPKPVGSVVAAPAGFTPTNWVMATGQLDGFGADELILGPDGAAGAAATTATVLTLGQNTWANETFSVGSAGLTSMTIGRLPSGQGPSLFFGTRPQTGAGSIVEYRRDAGQWSKINTNVVEAATGTSLNVTGMATSGRFIFSGTPSGQTISGIYKQEFSDAKWSSPTLLDALSVETTLPSLLLGNRAGRWIPGGAIKFSRDASLTVPPNALLNPGTQKWHFPTVSNKTWTEAEGIAVAAGGHLVTIADSAENTWLRNSFPGGPFWLGLYRLETDHFANPNSWKWVSGSTASYRNWHVGQPDDYDYQGFAPQTRVVFNTDLPTWNDQKDANLFSGLVELSNQSENVTLAAASGLSAHFWKGRTLASGWLRGTSASLSIAYGFIDDKEAPAGPSAGDDFVIGEYDIGSPTPVLRTSVRHPFASGNAAGAYGLTILRRTDSTKPGTLALGEPDGTVSLWTAPDATSPLVRKLFSTEFTGKAWHQMEPLKEADGREGLVGLLVDPATPQQCQVIHWSPEAIEAALSGTAPVLNHAPLARVLPVPSSGGARSVVGVRIWDAEAHAGTVALQVQRMGETAWTNARLVSVDGVVIPGGAVGTTAPLSSQPGGVSHTLVWNAGSDLGAVFTGTVLLRTRAADALTGEWSEPMPYAVNTAADLDTDGDGATDATEAAFGTNPNAASSRPAVQVTRNANGTLTFTWPAAAGRTYRLETSLTLANWMPLQSGLTAGSWTMPAPPNTGVERLRFYRVAAE